MDKHFKHLILKIAALPLSDQGWLLNQLSTQQKNLFAQCNGSALLSEARRFAKLPLPSPLPAPKLPDFCQELKNQPPLYLAIILEQGKFDWEQYFLAEYQQQSHSSLPMDKVQQIKRATKVAVFDQWQKTLHFAAHLEVQHGANL